MTWYLYDVLDPLERNHVLYLPGSQVPFDSADPEVALLQSLNVLGAQGDPIVESNPGSGNNQDPLRYTTTISGSTEFEIPHGLGVSPLDITIRENKPKGRMVEGFSYEEVDENTLKLYFIATVKKPGYSVLIEG